MVASAVANVGDGGNRSLTVNSIRQQVYRKHLGKDEQITMTGALDLGLQQLHLADRTGDGVCGALRPAWWVRTVEVAAAADDGKGRELSRERRGSGG